MQIAQTICMKHHKAIALTKKWDSSPVATLLFLLAAVAILYSCVRLVSSVAKNNLREDALQAPRTAAVTPAPSGTPDASARIVSAIRTPRPEASATPTVSPGPTPSVTPSPSAQPASTPSPAPTLLPVSDAAPLSTEGANLLLIVTDESGRPDWILAVRMRGSDCHILSIPKNTLQPSEKRLCDIRSAKACVAALAREWPVRYPITAEAKLSGLDRFVDQLGGITLDNRLLDGAAAAAFLESGPVDELLRIERQQAFLLSYLKQLQSVRLITLLAARISLEPYLVCDLSATEMLTLFECVRAVDAQRVQFHTLPVDSRALDGVRCYWPDVRLVNAMAAEWTK